MDDGGDPTLAGSESVTSRAAMEWFIMNASGVRSLAPYLVSRVSDDSYVLHDECAEIIEEMLLKIGSDDSCTSVTKRHLLAENIIKKDLLPIIKFASPDVNELELVLQLLAELCQPIDKLTTVPPIPDDVTQDLMGLTKSIRKAFRDIDFVAKLFHHVRELIDEAGEYEISTEAYNTIKNLFSIVRNILYYSLRNENSVQQAALKMLLLKNDLGTMLIYAITCHSRQTLVIPVSQLLALLYNSFQVCEEENAQLGCEEARATHYVNNKLQCLIVKLLQGSLSTLTLTLKKLELKQNIDTENYMVWCLSFFLPFMKSLPVSLSKIRGILSSKFVGYIVYQASMLAVKIFSNEPNPTIRQMDDSRLMLMLSALECIITAATSYKLNSLSNDELKTAILFYKDLSNMTDLWKILLFYIRNFDLTRFPRSLLSQLVCLNHTLLTAVELYNNMCSSRLEEVIHEHVKQFASRQVVQQFTLLVETYSTNSKQTNMAVFTMLCHICVDCQRTDLLYNPTLLRLLSEISHNPAASGEDRELAKYVTDSFLDDLSDRPQLCAESFYNTMADVMDVSSTEEDQEAGAQANAAWTDDEESDLFTVYTKAGDDVEEVMSQLTELGIMRSREEIAEKLMELGLIEAVLPSSSTRPEEDIGRLVSEICEAGDEDFIIWIRGELLKASYAKAMSKDGSSKLAPLSQYAMLKCHAMLIIPYTERQSQLLATNPKSKQLLNALGLSYEPFNGSFIPLIPDSKTAGELYTAVDGLKLSSEEKLNEEADGSMSSLESDDEIQADGKMTSSSGLPDPTRMGAQSNGDSNLWISYVRKSLL